MPSLVVAVHLDARHAFSKQSVSKIELIAGHGVRGDAHFGITAQHLSKIAKDPTQPNLRQVHLLHEGLLQELHSKGFDVAPGQLGENITTSGLAILALSAGTKLQLGTQVVLRVTGLRSPCSKIESFHPGLLAAVVDRAEDGSVIRKAGVMCVVEQGGEVRAGDSILVIAQPEIHIPLEPV